ncbi:MAG: HlyD family efflux transporter periplasmic adaptor subunit [Verrucomicrobiota bacterium]
MPPDGRIARITEIRADRAALETSRGRLAAAVATERETLRRVELLRTILAEREKLLTAHREAFKREVAARVAAETAGADQLSRQLVFERSAAKREADLSLLGNTSTAAAEAAAARVLALERTHAAAAASLEHALARQRAAEAGAYQLDDGNEPDWATHSLYTARLELSRGEEELGRAQALLTAARAEAAAADLIFDRSHDVILTAPPGSIVWSHFSAPHAGVVPGTQILSWVDPKTLLVDVPISDAEASLLHPGDRAFVVVEGETRTRKARVLLVRGSSGTLGTDDLVAIAKGRRPGIAQAILTVEMLPGDLEHPPISIMAFVDFPDVSILSIIRTRLRL